MSVTITAASVVKSTGSTLVTADLEQIINDSIESVNSDAGTTISYLTGSPGTITVTGDQAAAIKPMIAMKLASRAAAGGSSSSFAVGGINKSQSANSSPSDVNAEQYMRAIRRLKSVPIYIGKDTTGLGSE